jgi:inhibitor of KinA sporulation pathway (predicted exonuclease)
MSTYYFAIDVETTGQFITKNAMIAFGCTIMDQEMKEVEKFSSYLRIPEDRNWEDRCVNEFWSKQPNTLDYIKKHMKNPRIEMMRFSDWMDDMDIKYGSTMIVLSDFAMYDIAWINLYLDLFTDRWALYYMLAPKENWKDGEKVYWFRRIWTTDSVYHGALMNQNPDKYIQWNLEKELNIQNDKWTNDHDPLNDARNIAANYILFSTKHMKKEIKKTTKPTSYGWLNIIGMVLASWTIAAGIIKYST